MSVIDQIVQLEVTFKLLLQNVPLHNVKVMIWCAVGALQIVTSGLQNVNILIPA
jgi:hypothetical protein